MALIKCPDCGTEVSDRAVACPKCARPVSPPKKKKSSFASGCLIVLILMFVVPAIIVGIFGAATNSNLQNGSASVAINKTNAFSLPDEREVFYMAEDWIKDHLKSPSTAKFSNLHWDKDTGCKWIKKNRFSAMGFVDAQNSFGAMMREKWFAVIEVTPTNYFFPYWELGDQNFGQMPKD